jgi:predicted acyl esterase
MSSADDADTRRVAARHRHLPTEERRRQGAGDPVRTPYNSTSGHPERRARRHERAADGGHVATPTSCRTSADTFSEGNYDILIKDHRYNTVDWLAKQAWSNGKIGTTGCSSTAEYQWE